MPLMPDDVVRKSFRTSTYLKRGYDETDVDAFLEEIVDELRRLHTTIDELEAARLRPLSLQQLDEEQESERVAREREQLELVRSERRELVAELAELQTRLERARSDIQTAEVRMAEADRAADEAEARRESAAEAEAETASRLQRLTHEDEVLRGSHDGLVQELRSLRLAAETRAADVLGSDDLEVLGLSAEERSDDVAIIGALASRMHDQHVEEGRAEGERLLAEARVEAARLVDEGRAAQAAATQSAQRLVATAEQQSRDMLAGAEAERDRLVAEGTREREDLFTRAQADSKRLVTEAEEQRAGILADLNARRELLERRIDELDQQQAAYRDRLRALTQQQLASLDDDGWRIGSNGTGAVEAGAQR